MYKPLTDLHQLVILSGKGGTGKTSVGASFAHLSSLHQKSSQSILVDADVDAANLGLLLQPSHSQANEFWGGSLAEINSDLCVGCAECVSVCRFDAIFQDPEHNPAYKIDPVACDGCAACMYRCPESVIKMVPQQEGMWYRSETPFGVFFHAELFPGRENSGKLVTIIKQHARITAEESQSALIIIDGPPGIGCPVISACAGADIGLIVAEPGLAGLHDMDRMLDTLSHFHVPSIIAINKADLYPSGTMEIRKYASEHDIPIVGEIPFDEKIPSAMLEGMPVTVAYPQSLSALSIQSIWTNTINLLFGKE